MEPMLRLALLAAAALWAGCVFSSAETAADVDPADDDTRGAGTCTLDTDCTLAGPSCCECPTYAVAGDGGWADACEQVACPVPADCPALEARCDRGACVAACAPSPCDLSCPTGFAVDPAGCTTCACAGGGAVPQCQFDTDCVRVAGDCCGCDRGGSDVAVPAGELTGFVDNLGCTGTESCPGVSTCTAGESARCVAGRCALAADPTTMPPPTDVGCGRPELPPCPSGQVCVINADDAEAGMGRCEAPP